MSWEAIAGIASAVIAFCALGLTIWQGLLARKHNRLSATPHLTTWRHIDGDKNFCIVDLLNNGIGPALIKMYKLSVDGKNINGDGTDPIVKIIKILFPKYEYESSQAFIAPGYMMPANERRRLAAIQFIGKSVPQEIEVEHAMERVRLLIGYESIYGTAYELDTDKIESNV